MFLPYCNHMVNIFVNRCESFLLERYIELWNEPYMRLAMGVLVSVHLFLHPNKAPVNNFLYFLRIFPCSQWRDLLKSGCVSCFFACISLPLAVLTGRWRQITIRSGWFGIWLLPLIISYCSRVCSYFAVHNFGQTRTQIEMVIWGKGGGVVGTAHQV